MHGNNFPIVQPIGSKVDEKFQIRNPDQRNLHAPTDLEHQSANTYPTSQSPIIKPISCAPCCGQPPCCNFCKIVIPDKKHKGKYWTTDVCKSGIIICIHNTFVNIDQNLMYLMANSNMFLDDQRSRCSMSRDLTVIIEFSAWYTDLISWNGRYSARLSSMTTNP